MYGTIKEQWADVSIWRMLGTVAGAVVLFIIGAIISGLATVTLGLTETQSSQIDNVVLPIVTIISIGLPLWFLILRKHGWSLLEMTLPSKTWILIAIVVGVGWAIGGNLLSEALSRLLSVERRATVEFTSTFVDTLFLLLSAGLVVPIVEEILFRGIIFNWLRSRLWLWVAIAISALLFALVHFNPIGSANFFIMGVIFTLLYIRSKSLWVPIIGHMAGNSFVILFNYLT